MREIKLGFKYFWPGFDPEDNFFTNFLRKYYNVTISENPDYLIFSFYGGGFENHARKSGMIRNRFPRIHSRLKNSFAWTLLKNSKYWQGRLHQGIPKINDDTIKIFYTEENVRPDMSKCDWAFSFCYDREFKHPRHLRLPSYFVRGFGENLIKKGIDFQKIKKEKTKFCNFLYSNDVEYRNRFFKELNKYKRVDAPGMCMNNMPPLGDYKNPGESRNAFSWLEEKNEFLRKYKFTIAFESFKSEGYTTEKMTQPMAVNSIPIYFGNPLISRDFNPESFINVKNFEEAIEKIIEIDQNDDLYEKMLREPWFKYNKGNKYVDEGRLLKRFKEIFG
ncbi:MAG: glycosyltransferase family 10 [Nanoarchaeota archaeon]|nr:hypothetical protein [Nanoarchaeota archaeon]